MTTLRIPVAEIGRLAAERMLSRVSGGKVPKLHEIAVELVVRGSTAAPAKNP